MPEIIHYRVVEETVPGYLTVARVTELAKRGAAEWNRSMKGLVSLQQNTAAAQVFIEFGDVDRTDSPNRKAQCTRYRVKGPFWRIVLAKDVKWDVSKWWQFWQGGDVSLIAAITHEFGHVFLEDPTKPHWHSPYAGDVMHSNLLNHLIAQDEAARYRKRYREVTNL